MRVTHDDLWFCVDCLLAAVNGDLTGIEDDERAQEVTEGLERLGKLGHVVPDFDSETGEGILEFSKRGCDACECPLFGELHRFAILGK